MPKLPDELLIGGGLVLLYLVYQGYKSAEEVVTKHANPAHQGNIVNSTITDIGREVTGNPSWRLGSAYYDYVDWWKDVLPGIDSDREKQLKISARTRALIKSQNQYTSYNNLPEIF